MSVVNPGAPFPVTGTVADGSAIAAGDAPVLVAGQDGTNVQTLRTATDGTLRTDPTGTTTQPVSGTVTVTGVATEATLALIKAKTDNLDVALSTRAVTGLTDAQLRAAAVPVSAAALPLPSGAATSALQTTGNASLSSIDTKTPALGQTTMAASQPVTIASNQTALPITDNAGSLTIDTPQLPAALVGGRLDENVGAWLGSTAPTVGSKTSANSVPVVIASDQGAVPVSVATLPLPTGAATSANQTTLGSQTTKINDGTNTAAVKAASTGSVAADPALVVALSPNSDGPFEFGGDNRLRVGQETAVFTDTFEGAAVNLINWVQSQLTMTQAVATGALTLNSGSSLVNGAFSILSTNKLIRFNGEQGLYFQERARVVTQANAVLELGWGAAATTAAPTNGCFFRIPSSGVLQAVINFNGTETVTQMAVAGVLVSTTFYTFEIFAYEDRVKFEVMDPAGAVALETEVVIPAGQASPSTLSTLPMFARVYNTALTAAAAQVILANAFVSAMDSGAALVDYPSQTSVASSATNVTLLAANPNRRGATIFNDGNQNLFVKLGVTASTTSFTVRITSQGYYELPFAYVGQIDGIWNVANGSARITELF